MVLLTSIFVFFLLLTSELLTILPTSAVPKGSPKSRLGKLPLIYCLEIAEFVRPKFDLIFTSLIISTCGHQGNFQDLTVLMDPFQNLHRYLGPLSLVRDFNRWLVVPQPASVGNKCHKENNECSQNFHFALLKSG